MLRYKLKNKKAQVGETMTWVFATPIIIAILIFFIILCILLSQFKAIVVGSVKTDLSKESAILNIKTSLANEITNGKNKEIIDNILKQDDK